jgi:hypothetical protein
MTIDRDKLASDNLSLVDIVIGQTRSLWRRYDEDIEFIFERMSELRAEVKQLREYVMTPWYKKLWKAVKRIFRNGGL